jgi:iron complex transport system permease protein
MTSSLKFSTLLMAFLGLAMGLILLGLCAGSSGFDSLGILLPNHLAHDLMVNIRLPRTLAALSGGALLGLAGAVAQGLFRNPLADPYLLGSASGATLGVSVALIALGGAGLHAGWLLKLGLSGSALIGAWMSVLLSVFLARGFQTNYRLLLCGVVVGVIMGALCSALGIMHPQVLQSLQSFMMGSTSFADEQSSWLMLSTLALATLWALHYSRSLDALSLGELTAKSLGVDLTQTRAHFIGILSLCTGVAVSQLGLIAFVGLAAPHLVRNLGQVLYRHLIILSSLCGAVLLLASDILARSIIGPQELPLGLVTALLGGLYLLWLMNAQPMDVAQESS